MTGLVWVNSGRAEQADAAIRVGEITVETVMTTPEGEAPVVATSSEPAARPSWGKRLLWYLPNRVMDVLDIFRLRVRAGPGLSANLRMTDYASFYWGNYNTVYLGLPGPRYPYILRSPIGRESLNGMILAGVDATDDTRFGPQYGASEVDLGVNLLVVGAEVGLDPVEMGDFLAGLFFFDIRGDDYPRSSPDVPKVTSGLVVGSGAGMFKVDDKPAVFDSLDARLDYLHTNVQRRISEPIRVSDAYFAADKDNLIVAPETRMRATLVAVFTQDRELDFEFSPDIHLDVQLPNVEQRLNIFVETARNNALPETYTTDQEDSGINVGVRNTMESLHLSWDAGVRARIPPELFTRVIWSYEWNLRRWSIRPDARIFWETEDKFGSLASLYINRWIGQDQEYLLSPTVSGKWSQEEDTLTWSANLNAARVTSLLDERRRGYGFNWEDSARAQGLACTVFGSHGVVDKYRATLGFRGPLYKKWIYWDLDPGLQWEREDDYRTEYVVRVALDLLFWGQAYR